MRFSLAGTLILALAAPCVAGESVAQFAAVRGEVMVWRGGDRVAGATDAVLMAGDRVLTGARGQAEIHIDAATVFQAGPRAEFQLARPEYRHLRVELARGSLTYRVLGPSSAEVEVVTPSVSVRPHEPGVYRIGVSRAGQTEVLVREGGVQVFAPRGSEWVAAGQKMLARGPASEPEFRVSRAISRWRRLAMIISRSVDFGAVVSSAVSSDGGDNPKPTAKAQAPHKAVDPGQPTKTVPPPPAPEKPSHPPQPSPPSPKPVDPGQPTKTAAPPPAPEKPSHPPQPSPPSPKPVDPGQPTKTAAPPPAPEKPSNPPQPSPPGHDGGPKGK